LRSWGAPLRKPGFAATGREAREACETRIAETMPQTAERAGLKRSRNRFKQPPRERLETHAKLSNKEGII
jgi:hypothetical protein